MRCAMIVAIELLGIWALLFAHEHDRADRTNLFKLFARRDRDDANIGRPRSRSLVRIAGLENVQSPDAIVFRCQRAHAAESSRLATGFGGERCVMRDTGITPECACEHGPEEVELFLRNNGPEMHACRRLAKPAQQREVRVP